MNNNEFKPRGAYIIKTKEPFRDERGSIDNYELVFPVNMANIITSRTGDIRANHYHPEQTQQCLVVSGSYLSVFKDLTNPNAEIKTQIVKSGDLEVMPPMVAHTMIFLEPCVFVNLVPGNRDHDKFNVIHTIKYELVSPEQAKAYLEQLKGQ
jgi:dTDP-4-dehydrorhamnose 3,5-epimerase-like enzyme